MLFALKTCNTRLKICCSSHWQIVLSFLQCVSFRAFQSSLQYVSVLILSSDTGSDSVCDLLRVVVDWQLNAYVLCMFSLHLSKVKRHAF